MSDSFRHDSADTSNVDTAMREDNRAWRAFVSHGVAPRASRKRARIAETLHARASAHDNVDTDAFDAREAFARLTHDTL